MTPAERLAIELGAPLGQIDGRRVTPMLCERDGSGERILARPGWTYELKLDGVRIVADKRRDKVTLGYRKGREATDSYPDVCDAVRRLAEERVVLDGEVVAFDDKGRPDFNRLGTRIQTRGKGAERARVIVPVAYVVFDVLAIGDRDVTRLPIEERKRILEAIVGDAPVPSVAGEVAVKLHPRFSDGKELFRRCRELGLEGIVAKREGSLYSMGDRSSSWVKVKCELDADLVVIGWNEGDGRRSRLGALDLGVYDKGELVVRGRVGSGLDEDTIDVLLERMKPLEVDRAVARGKYSPQKGRHHVKPEIVVSVRHVGFTEDGSMRHPVFRGIREDVKPEDCRIDEGAETDEAAPRRATLTSPTSMALDGRTKADLVAYYAEIAPRLRGLLDGRLVMPLKVDGRARRKLVPLWPLPAWAPSWVQVASVPRGGQEVRGMLVEDAERLTFCVEAGAVAFAITNAREDAPKSADFAAFEIFADDASVARASAERLARLACDIGLASFPAEIHPGDFEVVVAVGDAAWEATRAFSSLMTSLIAAEAPPSLTVAPLDLPLMPRSLHPAQPNDTAVAWDAWPDLRASALDLGRAVVALDELVSGRKKP